jgi:Coproporphyrinogen III oxidase and related Fe-S oxidoreductases
VRRFSLERIEAELKLFVRRGVTQVFVLDSTFNQDIKRAKTILKMIRRIAPDIHFHFEVRSEFIDPEMAQLFADIVCSLQIGLQSADPDVLKQVGRNFRRDDFSRKISLLNESGAVSV